MRSVRYTGGQVKLRTMVAIVRLGIEVSICLALMHDDLMMKV